MTPVFVALTEAGLATARRAAEAIGGEVHFLAATEQTPHPSFREAKRHPLPEGERIGAHSPGLVVTFTDTAGHLRGLFTAGRPIIGVCAAGILIRILAPLLADKRDEPAVLALSEDGGSIVPLLGGHRGGANELARRLATALGGHAAITTAGDNRFGVALDAPPAGWTLANPENAKTVMAALLAGASARFEGEAEWLRQSRIPFAPDGEVRLIATTRRMIPPSRSAEGGPPPGSGLWPARGQAEAVEGATAGHGARVRPLHHASHGPPPPSQATGEEPALPSFEDGRVLIYHPRRLAIGIGCERGADPVEAIALVERILAEAGLARASIALVASIDLKADEPAVLEAAAHFGVTARFFTAAALEAETPRLKTPSDVVFREVGCHGVAEGAALVAAGADGELIVAKNKSARVTCAIAEASGVIDAQAVGRARGRLAVVGIGPGSSDWLTPEARRLLETSDAAVGYSLYLDLVAPLIAAAERFDSSLGSEEERARHALALAAEGRAVALVSSGDAGIYAMASLVFECLDRSDRDAATADVVPPPSTTGEGDHAKHGGGGSRIRRTRHSPPPPPSAVPLPRFAGEDLPDSAHRIEIIVAPGISAMQAAAARGGAPLGHDFCAISLSDLLTPWEAIEARIEAAAAGDFVVAFYNPVSQRRRTQLGAAKRILLRHRPSDTPVLIARNLGREGEALRTVALADVDVETVDMLTLVLVGASTTREVSVGGRSWLYTPRGYERKRQADAAE